MRKFLFAEKEESWVLEEIVRRRHDRDEKDITTKTDYHSEASTTLNS